MILTGKPKYLENDTDRKTKVLGGKPVPVPLCPLQIPCKLAWD